MRILISGASGTVGGQLRAEFGRLGAEVETLTRPGSAVAGEHLWDPAAGSLDARSLEGFDAIVAMNAGPPSAIKRGRSGAPPAATGGGGATFDGRIDSLALLAAAIVTLRRPPQVLFSASGSYIYGDHGDDFVDERTPVGTGALPEFLASLEQAGAQVKEVGVRHVPLRMPMLLHRDAAILRRVAANVRAGQVVCTQAAADRWMGWATLVDAARAAAFMLTRSPDGPVNLATPNPVRMRNAVEAVAAVVGAQARFGPQPAESPRPESPSVRLRSAVLPAVGFEFHALDIADAVGGALS